jgi:hypothetical protein
VFGRLRRVLRFHERVELPDVPAQAQALTYGGRTIVSYPPSPAWAVREPLWLGRRGLGIYAPSTAKMKRRLGLPDREIVLFQTGKLYASIQVLNMKKYYLIRVQRDKLFYIIRRFPVERWLRVDALAVRAGMGKAILAALLGCASLKKNKAVQSVEVAVRREEVVAHETLRLTTLLNDTIHLRNERLVIHYDTIRQMLRIEQVRPVVVVRDSVVRWNTIVQAPTKVAEGRAARGSDWWKAWGRGVFALILGLSVLGFIGYLWLRALKIE